MDRTQCKACLAPVYLVKHEKTGKFIQVDVKPSSGGNLLIDKDKGTYREKLDNEVIPASGIFLYLSHATTCPEVK